MTTSPLPTNITSASTLQNIDPSLQLPTSAKKTSNQLDPDAFLKLMLEQLKNQNPLSPQDSSQYLTQLAQMSSAQGISQINSSIGSLTSAMYANQTLQASAIVGRNVLARGSTLTVRDGQSAGSAGSTTSGAVDLPAATSGAFVQVFNASGALVREISLGAQPAGLANFSWDGKATDGTTEPAGTYTIQAGYRDGTNLTAADTLIATRVASVALGNDGKQARITTADGQNLGLTDIKAIF
jgi:flagellar basal-body rod modification protein FlgD